jgi:hypothetical protein
MRKVSANQLHGAASDVGRPLRSRTPQEHPGPRGSGDATLVPASRVATTTHSAADVTSAGLGGDEIAAALAAMGMIEVQKTPMSTSDEAQFKNYLEFMGAL